MPRYWLIWFALSFTAFIVPETIALATGHPERTLSAAIWRMEQLVPGQGIWQWNAAHMLFTSVFIVTVVWLIGHFGWGLWR
jgi:hypothetical protein